MGSSLKEKINEILVNVNNCQVSNTVADVSQGSATLEDICGLIELSASPHFGLTLNTDENYVVPLTIMDLASNLCQWITLVGKTVKLRFVVLLVEKFFMKSNCTEEQHISLIVKWDDVQFEKVSSPLNTGVESDPLVDSCVVDEAHSSVADELPNSTTAEDNVKQGGPDEVIEPKRQSYKIIVLSVASPFTTDQSVYCLVFVTFLLDTREVKRCWLILQNEQIAWREFLVPDKEYEIKLPLNCEKNYIEKSLKSLNAVFPKLIRGLRVVLHHSDLFPTLNSVILPSQSSISLIPNSDCGMYITRFVGYPFMYWGSVEEADYLDIELINLYGRVELIRYDREAAHKSCYLCIRAAPKEPKIKEPKPTSFHTWTNPWQSPDITGNKVCWELPLAKETNSSASMKTGVPGGLVQLIKLSDLVSGMEKTIYIKHSHVSANQQLCRLLPGMEICFTHLNRRQSESKNVYYVATFLSSLIILSCPFKETLSECWGTYGFREPTPSSREKIWGVLDAFSVSKVAITARCKACFSLFEKNCCSRQCSPNPGYVSSAHAIGRIQIINNNNMISVEKVLIKDEQVRKWLCIPDDEWENLLNAAAEEEIMCFVNDNHKNLPENPRTLSDFLKLYCEMARPKRRYYISVRKMSNAEGESPLYYCIHLEPFNKERFQMAVEYVKAYVASKNS